MSTYANYTAGDYDTASEEAKRYVKEYPTTPEAAYAKYLEASSYYAQILDISRDQERAYKAMTAFQELVKNYPTSEYVDDAKFKVQVTMDQLAGKEMSIGRFYLQRHNYTAAINRFRSVLANYQTTRHAEEALYRLVEAYLGLGITDEAQTAGAILGPQLPRRAMVQGRLRAVEEAAGSSRTKTRNHGSRSFIIRLFHPDALERGGHACPTFDPRHRADRSVGPGILAGTDDPDRRDRRGQIDPAGCAGAGARRARRRRAGAPWRGAGPSHRRFRAIARPSRSRKLSPSRTSSSKAT